MKITNTSIETLAPAGSGAASSVQVNQQGTAAKTSKTDSVNLSSASQLLSLAKAAAAAPDRSAKVSSVSAAVRSGQYSSDIASVSAAVVQGHIK
jgi:anti-sigma28 factor (negative regulator of flagellin synthesis)